MFILSITLPNLSIPDVPFPVLLSTLIRSRFQAKPATLLIFLSYFTVKELYGTWYQSGSFSLIYVGSGFHCLRNFSFTFLFKSHAGTTGNEYADALASEKSITVYSTLRIPPSKQPALREIPFMAITGLQKNMKYTTSYKINQTQPSYLPQGFDTYPITMTPCKHTCTPSTN
jgi:hypothetical protein